MASDLPGKCHERKLVLARLLTEEMERKWELPEVCRQDQLYENLGRKRSLRSSAMNGRALGECIFELCDFGEDNLSHGSQFF